MSIDCLLSDANICYWTVLSSPSMLLVLLLGRAVSQCCCCTATSKRVNQRLGFHAKEARPALCRMSETDFTYLLLDLDLNTSAICHFILRTPKPINLSEIKDKSIGCDYFFNIFYSFKKPIVVNIENFQRVWNPTHIVGLLTLSSLSNKTTRTSYKQITENTLHNESNPAHCHSFHCSLTYNPKL